MLCRHGIAIYERMYPKKTRALRYCRYYFGNNTVLKRKGCDGGGDEIKRRDETAHKGLKEVTFSGLLCNTAVAWDD